MIAMLVSYNTWVLAALNGHSRPLRGYVSELAAGGQHHIWVFRLGDGVAGLLMIAIAAAGLWGRGRRSGVPGKHWLRLFGRWRVPLAIAVALAGVSTIVGAAANMECAPTFDHGCAIRYARGFFAPGFAMHAAASVVAGVAVIASMVLAAIGLRATRARMRVAVVFSPASLWALAGVNGALSLASWGIEMRLGTGQGYVQIVEILLVSLWLGILGYVAAYDDGR